MSPRLRTRLVPARSLHVGETLVVDRDRRTVRVDDTRDLGNGLVIVRTGRGTATCDAGHRVKVLDLS